MRVDIAQQDTICALSTPPIPAALAIVRVSGIHAFQVRDAIFHPLRAQEEQTNFVTTRGNVTHPLTGQMLDDAICVSYPKGKSYTGEAAFELTLHGNPLIAQLVLQALVAAGCRLAQPGEFSMRAVLNGKLNLCEAEAVYDVIHAQSEQAVSAALKTLRGGLEKILLPVRETLVDVLCEVEVRLDFPDEDLGEASIKRLSSSLMVAAATLEKLLNSAQLGQRLMQGARIVLIGAPNAGKSTLMNALVGEERALVHDKAGTTRDVLEATWLVNGIPVTLIDVAGMREGEELDPVELMGIERAKRELERADIVLQLTPTGEPSLPMVYPANVHVIALTTKSDLSTHASLALSVSAKMGSGLKELEQRVYEVLVAESFGQQNDVVLTRARQKESVKESHEALLGACEALQNEEPMEVVASELRASGAALDELLGKELNEDVLDLIFSRFCIGK